jgi:hypothetical protein
MSSPYCLRSIQISGPPVSSPYKFDEEFYQQGSILNGNIDVDDATYGAANNRHKKHLREAHESIINSAKLEDFEPLSMPDPPRPLRAILPDYTDVKDPGTFFDMFVKFEDFELIVANTNKYTEEYASRYQVSNERRWKPTDCNEIKVYLTILIFLGLHKHSDPHIHWENIPKGSPCHYMTWKRYELLKSRIKVSDIDVDDEHKDVPGDWHFKVSPLDERLMKRFQDAVDLGSNISYDEQMLPFRGRSPHVTKVPGKPNPDGFKVWALCDGGYLFDWLYYSGSAGKLGVVLAS